MTYVAAAFPEPETKDTTLVALIKAAEEGVVLEALRWERTREPTGLLDALSVLKGLRLEQKAHLARKPDAP